VAALASGGLDSCVLIACLAQSAQVFPLYVQFGLAWEAEEQAALQAFIAAVANPRIQPVTVLQTPVAAMYGEHWSLTGRGVPDAAAPDLKVFLPGRNILLLAAAGIWCSTHGVEEVALGSLGGNPFPDATPEFFRDYGRLLSTGLGHRVEVSAPYRGMHKHDLIARHRDLPLELTLTCMAPRNGAHCGACNKCHERQTAFHTAGVPDNTRYAA
jgi:7-cyano-7-deazaguanine synthase